jgi:hypothetical protein
VFSGSKYAPATGKVGEKGYQAATCTIPKGRLDKLKEADPKKDTDVHVGVDNLVTYGDLFTGLGVCADATDGRISYIYENGLRRD